MSKKYLIFQGKIFKKKRWFLVSLSVFVVVTILTTFYYISQSLDVIDEYLLTQTTSEELSSEFNHSLSNNKNNSQELLTNEIKKIRIFLCIAHCVILVIIFLSIVSFVILNLQEIHRIININNILKKSLDKYQKNILDIKDDPKVINSDYMKQFRTEYVQVLQSAQEIQTEQDDEITYLVTNYNEIFRILSEYCQMLEQQVGDRDQELLVNKQQAENANQIKSELLSRISHGMRTHLNCILGYSEVLISDHDLIPSQNHKLEIIYQSGNDLLELINKLMFPSPEDPGIANSGELPTTGCSCEMHLVFPPQEEMDILYELAMLGSMRKIRERAIYLHQLDEKYLPLSIKLTNLAKRFQEKEIINLVEQYLNQE